MWFKLNFHFEVLWLTITQSGNRRKNRHQFAQWKQTQVAWGWQNARGALSDACMKGRHIQFQTKKIGGDDIWWLFSSKIEAYLLLVDPSYMNCQRIADRASFPALKIKNHGVIIQCRYHQGWTHPNPSEAENNHYNFKVKFFNKYLHFYILIISRTKKMLIKLLSVFSRWDRCLKQMITVGP